MSRHALGWPLYALKIAPLTGGSGLPSNIWFFGPTRVKIMNSITISSAAFAGLTDVTDRPIDWPCYSVCSNRPHLVVLWCGLIICIACLVASRVEAQWNKTELTENVTSLRTTIDELSCATINKLIAAHISWYHEITCITCNCVGFECLGQLSL